MRHKHLLILLVLLAIPALYADVTLRYKTEVRLNPALPNAAAGMKAMDSAMPAETLSQFKNGRGFTSQAGRPYLRLQQTGDHPARQRGETLCNTAGRAIQDAIAAAMPDAQRGQGDVGRDENRTQSKATGRSAAIHGIEAEEREIIMTTDAPPRPNLPAPAGPMMRMVIRCWTAKAREVMRVPAIANLPGTFLRRRYHQPAVVSEKMIQQMPMARDIASIAKEMQSGGTPVVLRVQFDMFMPMIARC